MNKSLSFKSIRSAFFCAIVLIFSSAGCSLLSAPDKPMFSQENSGSCTDYSKPVKRIVGYHYFDESVHLSPYYKGAPAKLQGYVVLAVQENSTYSQMGVLPGDVILEIDGVSTKKGVEEMTPAFKTISENSFNNTKIIRCSQLQFINNTSFKGP